MISEVLILENIQIKSLTPSILINLLDRIYGYEIDTETAIKIIERCKLELNQNFTEYKFMQIVEMAIVGMYFGA
jgi:hypothetical protein